MLGGGGAIVGIIWLVPIFGVYFAVRLERSGRGPENAGRALAISLLALLAFAATAALGFAQPTASARQFALIAAGSAAGILITWKAWADFAGTMFAYGLAARIPVALVVLVAILSNWGTHYDNPPPGLPAFGPLARWVAIGLIPQLTLWMAVTVICGSLFGGLAVAVVRRRRAPEAVGALAGRP